MAFGRPIGEVGTCSRRLPRAGSRLWVCWISNTCLLDPRKVGEKQGTSLRLIAGSRVTGLSNLIHRSLDVMNYGDTNVDTDELQMLSGRHGLSE
jgi:hypothetical protein